MQELINQFNEMFKNNQVISTVAGGSLVVWLVTNIKMIWGKVVSAVTALVSFTVVNIYEDNSGGGGGWNITTSQIVFNDLLASSKAIWERSRHLDLSSIGTKFSPEHGERMTYGNSVRLLFGKLVICSRTVERQQKITVTTVVRVFFANKEKFMEQLHRHIRKGVEELEDSKKNRDYIRVYYGEGYPGYKMKRQMNTIYTNHNEHYRLLESIRDFCNNKEKYRSLAYPYSFSALLYGSPGCGKTSSILAIASELGRDITYINMSKTSVGQILDRINIGGQESSIIVFEDIDALRDSVNRKRKEADAAPVKENGEDAIMETLSTFGNATSLSDLLNITDGLLSSDGLVCLFTTNHIERLDPALLRAGRMNEMVEFTNLNSATAARMLRDNLKWEVEPEDLIDSINPAELQTAILKVALGRSSRDEIEEKFFK